MVVGSFLAVKHILTHLLGHGDLFYRTVDVIALVGAVLVAELHPT